MTLMWTRRGHRDSTKAFGGALLRRGSGILSVIAVPATIQACHIYQRGLLKGNLRSALPPFLKVFGAG